MQQDPVFVAAHERPLPPPTGTISDVEMVASYTWLDRATPTIAVPGAPATWTPTTDDEEKRGRTTIRPDDNSTIQVLDYNRYHYPNEPMAPALYAVLHIDPAFDFTTIHVISDKQPLALLLKLADAKVKAVHCGKEHDNDSFTAHLVGKTVLLTRNDDKITAVSKKDARNYRKGYEAKYFTKPTYLMDGQSHFAVTKFKLDDLNIMVRHSVDAAMDGPRAPTAYQQDPRTGTGFFTSLDLNVLDSGVLLSSAELVELNTFKQKKDPSAAEARRDEKRREAWLSQAGHSAGARYAERWDRRQGLWGAEFAAAGTDVLGPREPDARVAEMFGVLLGWVVKQVEEEAKETGARCFRVGFDYSWYGTFAEACAGGASLPGELEERVREVQMGKL